MSICSVTHSGLQAGGLGLYAWDVFVVIRGRDDDVPGRLGGFTPEQQNALQESKDPIQKLRKRKTGTSNWHSWVVRSLKGEQLWRS